MQTAADNKWDSLEKVIDNAWAMLSQGAADAKDPFHTPVLGTLRADQPSLRTVILRQVIALERILICHTDLRSDKIQEIQNQARLSWLFYHPQEKVQLRLTGQAKLHTDDALADQQWAGTPLTSRRLYCVLDSPGTPINEPSSRLPDSLVDRLPTLAESEIGRKNFAVIVCQVDFMDWLFLRTQGHRRAQFRWQASHFIATWVVP